MKICGPKFQNQFELAVKDAPFLANSKKKINENAKISEGFHIYYTIDITTLFTDDISIQM